MRHFFSHRLERPVVTLKAGDYHATRDGEVLLTVLGSCIAACLYDTHGKVGGMNHFLLAETLKAGEIASSEAGRYGMYAMELLMGELVKLGARRESLRAKLFGGANVLGTRTCDFGLCESNIHFARHFLELEGIPVVNEDLGGDCGRKIIFFSDTGRVLLKRFNVQRHRRWVEKEEIYRATIKEKQSEKPPVVFF